MKTSMVSLKNGLLRIGRKLNLDWTINKTFSARNSAQALNSVESVQSQSNRLLEVYLFYPRLKGDHGETFKELFERELNNIDAAISGQPIFLDRFNALRYSRFMGNSSGILKAYVSELAIEGRYQELLLKRGFLTKDRIHGCYPGWAKGGTYFVNPEFDEDKVFAN